MFPFSRSILLIGVGAGHVMGNDNALKERVEGLIIHPPIGLDSQNLPIELPFNKILEIMKILKHLRFMAQKINPGELAVIIN